MAWWSAAPSTASFGFSCSAQTRKTGQGVCAGVELRRESRLGLARRCSRCLEGAWLCSAELLRGPLRGGARVAIPLGQAARALWSSRGAPTNAILQHRTKHKKKRAPMSIFLDRFGSTQSLLWASRLQWRRGAPSQHLYGASARQMTSKSTEVLIGPQRGAERVEFSHAMVIRYGCDSLPLLPREPPTS